MKFVLDSSLVTFLTFYRRGCIRCARVFRPCQEKRSQKEPILPLEQLFTYPDSPEEILSTRVDQLRRWSSMVNTVDGVFMPNACPSPPDYLKFEVTEHFLDGERLSRIVNTRGHHLTFSQVLASMRIDTHEPRISQYRRD